VARRRRELPGRHRLAFSCPLGQQVVASRGDSIASEMGTAWHVSPLDADSQGAIVQFAAPELTRRKASGERVPGWRRENVPRSSRVVRTGPGGLFRKSRTALRNALGALGVKLGAALDAPPRGHVLARLLSVRRCSRSQSAVPRGIHSSPDFRACQEWNERGSMWSHGAPGVSCPRPPRRGCGRAAPAAPASRGRRRPVLAVGAGRRLRAGTVCKETRGWQ